MTVAAELAAKTRRISTAHPSRRPDTRSWPAHSPAAPGSQPLRQCVLRRWL